MRRHAGTRRDVAARIAAALFAAAAWHSSDIRAGEPLGRLFFTPEQRAHFDVLRSQRGRNVAVEAPPEPEAPSPVVTYSGMVKRSDGRSTIWINGRAVQDGTGGDREPRARLDADGAATVVLPQQRARVRLKVGQTADLGSGQVVESYARRPPPPEQTEAQPAPPPAAPPFRLRHRRADERDDAAPGVPP